MKRYLMFQGDMYYPAGGWADLTGSFDDRLEALASYVIENYEDGAHYRWGHLVDAETGRVLAERNTDTGTWEPPGSFWPTMFEEDA